VVIVISLFKMDPTIVLKYSIPKCKQAVLSLIQKMPMLDKLDSGKSYSYVGCKSI
jgi:hypothetical protein